MTSFIEGFLIIRGRSGDRTRVEVRFEDLIEMLVAVYPMCLCSLVRCFTYVLAQSLESRCRCETQYIPTLYCQKFMTK